MSFIETHALKNSTIMFLYSERSEIQSDPDYQRMGGVWTLEKRRLLIDSIINDYDIPKIYFHEFSREQHSRTGYRYAVIDGRQRLETIWSFMDDRFTLSADVSYQADETVDLAGLNYSDIAKEYPKIRVKFDSFVLPVVAVRTDSDDIDLIEDMFSRLNEAVPLNAAEKRNAIGGDLVEAIRRVSQHDFFLTKVRFSNTRYQHREIAGRMLLTEYSVTDSSRIIDTKKVYLDQMVSDFHSGRSEDVHALEASVVQVLDSMCDTFAPRDELLLSQGIMVVYFLLFKETLFSGQRGSLSRRSLLQFREDVRANRVLAEIDFASSKFELLEFDRLNQQGTNDASSIIARFRILCDYVGLNPTLLD